MTGLLFLIACSAALLGAYAAGRGHALSLSGGQPRDLAAQPVYHGVLLAIACGVPALSFAICWWAVSGALIDWRVTAELQAALASGSSVDIASLLRSARELAAGSAFSTVAEPSVEATAGRILELQRMSVLALCMGAGAAAAVGGGVTWRRMTPAFQARAHVESFVRIILLACSTLAILTTIGIVLSLVFEAARFFAIVPPFEFFFGLRWSPQTALRADQIGSSGAFGAVPVFAGTLLITLIALSVAVPTGLFAAIYLSEYATKRVRTIVKPTMEVLAGIPIVVYGFFAALTVAPVVRSFGSSLGLDVSSESALAAGLVMGIMIIPFVSSLSDDVIRSVPQSLRDAGLALGATHAEMVRSIVLPAALPGIAGAVLLATSRAIGETMIVVMAAGLSARLSANPFDAVTTVTVQIVTLLVGDQEFDSAKTLAAFALGLVLFVITLGLNIIALQTVRKYREQYE